MKKTIIYFIIGILLIFGKRLFLNNDMSDISQTLVSLISLVGVVFVIAAIRNLIIGKGTLVIKEEQSTNPINKRKGLIFVILGLIFFSSIVWLPKIFCRSDDFICGGGIMLFGMLLTATGLILIIRGLKYLFKDKKLF